MLLYHLKVQFLEKSRCTYLYMFVATENIFKCTVFQGDLSIDKKAITFMLKKINTNYKSYVNTQVIYNISIP